MCVISNLSGEKLLEHFIKKSGRRQGEKGFRVEKLIKRKGDRLCLKGMGYDDSFDSWINMKDMVYERPGENVKNELDLFNYATKTDLKGATGINTSTLTFKTDLASLKTKRDNLNIDKLKTAGDDLSKLGNVVDTDVVKKNLCLMN